MIIFLIPSSLLHLLVAILFLRDIAGHFTFIYVCLWWVFIAARGLSLVVASRGHSSLQYVGPRLQWLLLLQSTDLSTQASVAAAHRRQSPGSVVVAHGAQLLHGMWNLPGPEIERMSPAVAAGFLSTMPPDKSIIWHCSVNSFSFFSFICSFIFSCMLFWFIPEVPICYFHYLFQCSVISEPVGAPQSWLPCAFDLSPSISEHILIF